MNHKPTVFLPALAVFFVTGFFAVWVFFVTSRFCYPLVPVLFVFTAAALFWMWNAVLKKEFAKIVIAGITAVPLVIAAIPQPLTGGFIRPEDLGLGYQRQEHYGQAIQSYNRVLALRPGNPQARFHLLDCMAVEAQKQNRYAQAAVAFKEALDLEPHDEAIRYNFFPRMSENNYKLFHKRYLAS